MECIKQVKGSSNCVAVTAANAFNSTVEEFESVIGECPEDGYGDLDFYRFALQKGYTVGAGYDVIGVDLNERAVNLFAVIKEVPAYVVVKSETIEGKTHAVYFDGYKVYDPNPDVKELRELSSYVVLLFFPIGSIETNLQLRSDLLEQVNEEL